MNIFFLTKKSYLEDNSLLYTILKVHLTLLEELYSTEKLGQISIHPDSLSVIWYL
jgi:hypothetical protein